MKGELLPVAVRAYARKSKSGTWSPRPDKDDGEVKRVPPRRSPYLLVYDTETRTDIGQGLLMACYRFYVLTWTADGPTLDCVEEGLVYADELPQASPPEYRILRGYAARNLAETVPAPVAGIPSRPDLRLRSRADFVEQVFFRALVDGATVAMFNAPFDLSRLSVKWAEARRGFRGGFSFDLFEKVDAKGAKRKKAYRPRVLVNPRDAKMARLGLSPAHPGKDAGRAGSDDPALLDLKTLAYALTGKPYTLEKACDAFDVPYEKREVKLGEVSADLITYCREDVAATAALYGALASEYERWRLERPPSGISSPATLAKEALREAGVTPLRERLKADEESLGQAMVAYYGGRAEVRVRRVSVPVVYLDFASMYPTVATLLGVWRFMVATAVEKLEVEPKEFADWLAGLTRDDVFEPDLWSQLCGFALVKPRGDVLPVRAPYSGDAHGIGINPLHCDESLLCDEPIWYTLADVVAARLLGDTVPEILRVVRLKPSGVANGLRPLSIRGSRPIDPSGEDVFRAMVQERRRLEAKGNPESKRTAAALKVVANSAAYGIAAELNRQPRLVEPTALDVFGLAHFGSESHTPENPGRYFYSPLAAMVTGAARLMLGLCEACVSAAGGSYAFCDTDSMAVVATEQGGFAACPGGTERDEQHREGLRALSWDEVEAIRGRFESLNPYERELVPGSILELEKVNRDEHGERRQLHCFAISAKRYALYTIDEAGEPELVDWKEHGLGGFYMSPLNPDDDENRDWVKELWEVIVREDGLGLPARRPAWLGRPALTRWTASHPPLLSPFGGLNAEKTSYGQQVKPGNFLLVAHVAPGGHPSGVEPKKFRLIAPYEKDAGLWTGMSWRNIRDPHGPTYRLVGESLIDRGGRSFPHGTVGVKTYGHVLAAYRRHPEAKSAGADGERCSRRTVGLLSRLPVQAMYLEHIGKEANFIDEAQADLVGDEAEILATYTPRRRRSLPQFVVPALRALPLRSLADASGLPIRTVQYAREGRPLRGKQERALIAAGARLARDNLKQRHAKVPRVDLAALAAFLVESVGHQSARTCEGCGAELKGRQRRWCASCRSDYRQRLSAKTENPGRSIGPADGQSESLG